ncbi:MAG: NTP transferase domain-containing protein [Nitrospinota bacterium]
MIALVPLKGFRNGKLRLSPVLNEESRGRLTSWMMERVLRSLQESRSVERIILISKDRRARSVAAAFGAETFAEKVEGLNSALREAVAHLIQMRSGSDSAARGTRTSEGRDPSAGAVDTVLIVPADLPLLTAKEVDEVAALCDEKTPCVVAAPSQRGEGTNALLLHPPNVLTPSFGPDSFNRHRSHADVRKIPFRAVRSPRLGLDIDLPEDLEALRRALGPEAREELSVFLASGPVGSP